MFIVIEWIEILDKKRHGVKEMNLDRLLFYDNLRKDETVRMAAGLAERAESGLLEPTGEELSRYYEIQRRLLDCISTGDTAGTYWENYIFRLVAESENRFSLSAEKSAADSGTISLAEGDVALLQEIAALDWAAVARVLDPERPCVCAMEPPVEEDGRACLVRDALEPHLSAAESVRKLEEYYRLHCCGVLGKYRAFLWNGELVGIKKHDPITFDDLIGYDVQQQQLIRNTEVFVRGKRANNVLLYGDKGTGKSSSVKALLNYFGDRGLRMINVPKARIFDITKIMEMVADRGGKFIIFIDDLSFESTEIEYKHFKSVLEGGVETQPENVLVYVTSNRRNLVKETWTDRNSTDGEIFAADGIQERQSLADRFGLTITFYAPDKELYSEIVKSLIEKEGIDIDERQLLSEANKWDMRQTSRSGRSAKQFVTHISGILDESARK